MVFTLNARLELIDIQVKFSLTKLHLQEGTHKSSLMLSKWQEIRLWESVYDWEAGMGEINRLVRNLDENQVEINLRSCFDDDDQGILRSRTSR